MVTNGANAGNLSPLSAVGVIANNAMTEAGMGGHEWKVFAANFLAHCLVGAARVRAAHPPDDSTGTRGHRRRRP